MSSTTEQLQAVGWDVVAPEVVDPSGEPPDLELSSAAQLQALTDGFRIRLLAALGRGPGSAKDLADRLDVPTTRLYHHLDLLEDHGFVQVVATRRSGARTERCYGKVPWGSVRPGRALVEGADRAALGEALRAIAELVGVTLQESFRAGALRVPLPGEDDDSPDVVTWAMLRLTRTERQAFGAELEDLAMRIAATSAAHRDDEGDGADVESCVAYLVLAPDVLSSSD